MPRSARSGCLKAALITFGILAAVALVVGLLLYRTLTNFDSRREMMALRSGLEVTDEHLRYSPGMDGIMWSRFTVEAKGIDEVFDTSQVDVSEFDQPGYQLEMNRINDRWWDVKGRKLTGGSIEVRNDEFMHVGYVDNGDGTLTVYIYWFEV
ncbi:hypothetical protein HAHE_19680 [Haloferula helveola]|uniref:Uncharacterized protein n=2 Tax=Haloferula helveola TaxID=490095 RepID=A0ABM7RFI7_9BACT|nr:hypothetical protein HAHE_19680 [Haloferula helveola]